MEKLILKKTLLRLLRPALCLMTGVGAIYGLSLASRSDANMISTAQLSPRILLAMFMIVGGILGEEMCSERLTIANREIRQMKRQMKSTNLFSLSNAMLLDHFQKSGCQYLDTARTGRILGEFSWKTGSVKSHLLRWLKDNNIPHVTTFDGDVWFSERGTHWQTAEFDVSAEGEVKIFERVPLHYLLSENLVADFELVGS